MNRVIRKFFLLAAVLMMNVAMCAVGAGVPVYGEEAAEDTENKDAVPVLVVEGNTIYVDAKADGPWNTIQATVKFDDSVEVEDYGVMKEFALAASDQELMGFPAYNVTDDGEFIFTAVYTSADGTGVEYDGHLFYITFKDTSDPIDFTLYDEFNYELLSAAVDGAEEAVTYTPSDEVLAANEAQHEANLQAAAEADGSDAEVQDGAQDESAPEVQNDANENAEEGTDSDASGEKEGSSRSALLIIIVIAVVVLAAVAVVFSRKNGQAEDAAPDGKDMPEYKAIGGSDVTENKEIKPADRPGEQKTEELSGQDKD